MQRWSTTELPPEQQFAYWREVLCEAFTTLDPIVPSAARESFASKVEKKEFLGVSVVDVRSKRQTVVHGLQEVRRATSDYFFLNMQLQGRCVTRQDGREAVVDPGQFVLVDTTRTYELVFDDWRTLSIRIPRHLLMSELRHPDAATAIRVTNDGALGSVVISFVQSLLQCPEDLHSRGQEALVRSLISLLAGVFGQTPLAAERDRECIRVELRAAIIAYVKTHIADRRLSTAFVAARFGMSPRYLQKIFEDHEQSFAEMMLQSRIERLAEDLVALDSRRIPISSLAYKWGFADFSSFCRTFRRRFGMSATDYRALHQKGRDA